MSKIDEFKEYARKRIVDKLRDKENDTEVVEASNIHSYDGEDAFYSGNDEDYKEFLEEFDMDMEIEAEPVENTQKFNIGDIVNVKEVVDKVKEAAGNIVEAAAKVTEKVTESKREEEDIISDTMEKIDVIDERLEDVSENFGGVQNRIETVNEAVASLDKRIQDIEIKISALSDDAAARNAEIKQEFTELKAVAEQIRNSVNGVSKLSDSVFDMKNMQQNTKTALTDLQVAFMRLKKKTVAGIAILSVISFIVIALEVINLLA